MDKKFQAASGIPGSCSKAGVILQLAGSRVAGWRADLAWLAWSLGLWCVWPLFAVVVAVLVVLFGTYARRPRP